ncbi:MAG: phage protease [Puniceicoccales bacterium]|jgi:hypothetical protein|nr:phage protease [Puniceicoccales bacterium]
MDTALQEINWHDSSHPDALPAKRWMKLIDYGEYFHPQGVQCIHHAFAQAMVDRFRSFRGRLQRKFGGLPLYIGHPDDPQFHQQPGHQDTRAYAWIQDMDARDDGLWILVKWSDAGLQLIRNAFFKFFSPRWEVQPIDHGKFKPIRLLSVGLTNRPNIPGDTIANQEVMEAPKVSTFSENLELFLSHGIGEGHIMPNECPEWEERYRSDPEHAKEEIQTHRHGLHLHAHSASLQGADPHSHSKEQLLSCVHRRMQVFGESYTDAWASVRQSHPYLF